MCPAALAFPCKVTPPTLLAARFLLGTEDRPLPGVAGGCLTSPLVSPWDFQACELCTHVHTHVHTHMHTCDVTPHICMHAHIHIDTHVHTHAHLYACVCACMHKHTRAQYACAHTHMYTHARTCTHARTHTPECSFFLPIQVLSILWTFLKRIFRVDSLFSSFH